MPHQSLRALKPWQIAVSGMVAFAVAMGIGRFAFTPLLPMMLADGVTDLPNASWLASANYLGYMVGALLCMIQPWLWRIFGATRAVDQPAMVRLGLMATVVLTLSMSIHVPALWPLMRFAAGVASALVFVYASLWCLVQLARRHEPEMGAVIYAGPGCGIVLSGLAASGMVVLHWSAASGWVIFGLLAAGMTGSVWRVFHARNETSVAASPQAHWLPVAAAPSPSAMQIGMLATAYGLAGFGYIITATFLPVIARQQLPGSGWLDLFWPIFGTGVISGALIASRLRVRMDLRLRLALCYGTQALAIVTSLVYPSLAGFALGSLLLGLPFTAISFYGMQEARRLKPAQATSLIGLLTALYALGQVLGPPLVASLLTRRATVGAAFSLSLEIAAASLLLGALIYLLLMRIFPAGPPAAPAGRA